METLESRIDSFEEEDQTEVVRSADLTVLNPPGAGVPILAAEAWEEDLTGDLIIEFGQEKPKLSRFFLFLFSPHYPEPLICKFQEYLGEVRLRMIELRNFDRVQYHNTLYQGFRRLLQRSIEHAKANLRT